MPLALEHIRRMRGGAQAHLLRGDDGYYYVVKFRNNPQHPRVLANEMLGTRLAGRMGLVTPPVAAVEVRHSLIAASAELVMQVGMTSKPCAAGLQFGSRYPGEPGQLLVYDLLPDEQLKELENPEEFLGMLVFDKWTCNTNGRQAIFFIEPGRSRYQAMMIDNGFCFNAGEWSFPDAPLRGLYSRQRVYQSVTGMESFEPWLARLERFNETVLDEAAKEIPAEWYDADTDGLYRLLEQLHRRRKLVPQLILAAKDTYRQPFPNWK
jgi:hypothetical protein